MSRKEDGMNQDRAVRTLTTAAVVLLGLSLCLAFWPGTVAHLLAMGAVGLGVGLIVGMVGAS